MNVSPRFVQTSALLIITTILLSVNMLTAQAPKEEFKPSGKIWGYAFLDFFSKIGGDTAKWASRADYSAIPLELKKDGSKEAFSAFSLRRMYLGYDYNISPVFSSTALLEANDVSLNTRGERTVFIKALNLKWKNIYKGADLVIGQQPTLAYTFIDERVWNYRSIEKTLLDQRGVRASSDLGLAIYGRFDSLATYGYNVMISNGAGTRPEEITGAGKYKLYAADVYGYFLHRKIVIDLYGELQQGLPEKDFIAIKAFVGYQTEALSFGFEVYSQTQHNVKSDSTNATPFEYSFFAHGRIIKNKLEAFARFDSANPDNSYRDQDAIKKYDISKMYLHYDEQFLTAGLDYTPHKNVHIMPNIWVNSYKAKADTALLVDRVADVVPRLTFYFIFR